MSLLTYSDLSTPFWAYEVEAPIVKWFTVSDDDQVKCERIHLAFSPGLLKSQLYGTVAGICCTLSICACAHTQSSDMMMRV